MSQALDFELRPLWCLRVTVEALGQLELTLNSESELARKLDALWSYPAVTAMEWSRHGGRPISWRRLATAGGAQ